MPRESARLLSGTELAATIRTELQVEVAALAARGIVPGLAVVLVGEDPASQVYVRNKRITCEALGIRSFAHDLPASCTQKRLLTLIDKLNNDPAVHGILVQMPLPKQISEAAVLNALDPKKDVDGFHPINVGKLLNGDSDGFVPCTPAGCIELLVRNGIETAGKHAVIVGRSNIVGKPLAALLMQKGRGGDATVTVCHSRTSNLLAVTREADLLFAAIGRPEFISGRMVKPGAVVIDVGINRIDDPTKKSGSRLVGDVNFAEAVKRASAITPVPGGVGPMTIAMLLRNTVTSAGRTKTMKRAR